MTKILFTMLVLIGIFFSMCQKDKHPSSYKITSIAGVNGEIDPVGVFYIESGESITYSINPNPGFSILSVKVDGIDQAISNTIQFTNISSDRTIEVVFISSDIVMLIKAPWFFKNSQTYDRYDKLLSEYVPASGLTDKYYFYQNGKYELLNEHSVVIKSGNWSLNDDVFVIKDFGYEVKELSDKVFSYKTLAHPDPFDYVLKYTQYNYWRP